MGDLEVVKNMLSGKDISSLSLDEIADIIRKDWKKVYFGAVPYLDAMGSIDSSGMYLADPWQSIVAYFLGNANTWKGPVAKEVKAELKKRLKKNKMARLQKIASSLRLGSSLAEFKRGLQLGTKWHTYHHGSSIHGPKDMGVREVSKVQTNAVAFKTDRGDSWLQFPKAKDLKIEGDSFTVLEDGVPLLTYKKVG